MEFYVNSFDSNIVIPIIYEQQFKRILKEVFDYNGDLDGVLVYGFNIYISGNINIIIESFSGNRSNSIELFLLSIAPIVNEGSYMCFKDGDDNNWRVIYEDGECKMQCADVITIWDTDRTTVKQLDEDTGEVEDVPVLNGSFLYLSKEDAEKVEEILKSNGIGYVIGKDLKEILLNNNTEFTLG